MLVRYSSPRAACDSTSHRHTHQFQSITLVFQQSKYEVVTATTQNGALTLARAESFNLFILDSRLPDGSGFELCREIRRLDRSTPILFYSALAFEQDRDEALRAGAQKYLVKPVSIPVLYKTVAELIGAPADKRQAAYEKKKAAKKRTDGLG